MALFGFGKKKEERSGGMPPPPAQAPGNQPGMPQPPGQMPPPAGTPGQMPPSQGAQPGQQATQPPKQGPVIPGGPQPEAPERPKGTPVEHILTMKKQGMGNTQIIQTLRQQGYSPQQIFDAMNQASIKAGVAPAPQAGNAPGAPAPGQPTSGPKPPEAPKPGAPMPAGPIPTPAGIPRPPAPHVPQGIEETVEAVVEEKWQELEGSLSKLNDWKDETSAEINKVKQSIEDMKADMDNLHKAIVSKIGEYDQNMLNVGTEIKAMEKVFSKVLPTFTENVNELTRVTKKVKSAKKKTK